MKHKRFPHLLLALLASIALLAAACGDDDGDDGDAEGTEQEATDDESSALEGDLTGVFGLTDGACDDAGMPSGSYFRMVQVGGDIAEGPFIDNGDSACSDTTYTLLSAGTDGGLVSGDHQPAPDPAFGADNAALADGIIAPVSFFGSDFSAATDPVDGQSGDDVPAPLITAADGALTGDVSALAAYYGGEVFNQGAPKPGGSEDGPTGTIDPETGEYVLEWSSQIEGGAFNEFTGVWHLEGTFSAG